MRGTWRAISTLVRDIARRSIARDETARILNTQRALGLFLQTRSWVLQMLVPVVTESLKGGRAWAARADQGGVDSGAEEVLEEGHRLRRREFLIAGAGAGLALASPLNYGALARARMVPRAKGGAFAYGVASGIPSPEAITLWTRLKGIDRTSKLRVEVATTQASITWSGAMTFSLRPAATSPCTRASAASTLRSSTTTASRPRTRSSAWGSSARFRPLTRTSSCESASTRARATRPGTTRRMPRSQRRRTLDLVLCLGDYIYEHHYYDGPAGRVDKTGTNKDGDVQTLAEYRTKYNGSTSPTRTFRTCTRRIPSS